MLTAIVEAVSEEGNWGKFLIGRFDATEWARRDTGADAEFSLIATQGWGPEHILVLDLATGEGAMFQPGGMAMADLNKHAIWVCPLFEPFLEWLYDQDLTDLTALPAQVRITGVPLQLAGYRRPGPDQE